MRFPLGVRVQVHIVQSTIVLRTPYWLSLACGCWAGVADPLPSPLSRPQRFLQPTVRPEFSATNAQKMATGCAKYRFFNGAKILGYLGRAPGLAILRPVHP
jgi:hypothetical protein